MCESKWVTRGVAPFIVGCLCALFIINTQQSHLYSDEDITRYCNDFSYDHSNEVSPGLHLGNMCSAYNISSKFDLIINMCKRCPSFGTRTVGFPIKDSTNEDLLTVLPNAVREIEHAIKANRIVLVHCKAGVSRSSSVVIAYLMKTNKWSFEQSLSHVRASRTIANPNPGFRRQLDHWGEQLILAKQKAV